MVCCFNRNDVSAEIWTEQKSESANHIRTLWFSTGQRKLSELLVRAQHDQVRSEHNPAVTSNSEVCRFQLKKFSVAKNFHLRCQPAKNYQQHRSSYLVSIGRRGTKYVAFWGIHKIRLSICSVASSKKGLQHFITTALDSKNIITEQH